MIWGLTPWQLLWGLLKYHLSGQAIRDEVRAQIAVVDRPKCPYCGR